MKRRITLEDFARMMDAMPAPKQPRDAKGRFLPIYPDIKNLPYIEAAP